MKYNFYITKIVKQKYHKNAINQKIVLYFIAKNLTLTVYTFFILNVTQA